VQVQPVTVVPTSPPSSPAPQVGKCSSSKKPKCHFLCLVCLLGVRASPGAIQVSSFPSWPFCYSAVMGPVKANQTSGKASRHCDVMTGADAAWSTHGPCMDQSAYGKEVTQISRLSNICIERIQKIYYIILLNQNIYFEPKKRSMQINQTDFCFESKFDFKFKNL
jgi:hypothetical protein